MEKRGVKALKRTAFSLKLENFDDFEESYRSPKRCKTFHENCEDEKEKNVAEEYCDKITIIIKDVKEKRELEIQPEAFVTELREEVSKDFKIPLEQVSLYFNGQILRNKSTLSNSKIKDGSKVYVIRDSNQTTSDRSPSSRSRRHSDMLNEFQQNSETEYVVSTPDIPKSPSDESRDAATIEELFHVEEIEEEDSSASFDDSPSAEDIIKSMTASGDTPDKIIKVLLKKVCTVMKMMNKKLDRVEKNLKILMESYKQQKEDEANKPALQETNLLHDRMVLLPPHINLPLNSEDKLNYFEQMLSTSDELASNMVMYLYQSSHGKSPCAFLLNVTRLVLSQELASSYSRFGRKGKKSFLPYKNTTDVILAAASKKFSMDRDTLYEKFGRALANAPEWNGRKSRMQISTNDLNMSELTEISN